MGRTARFRERPMLFLFDGGEPSCKNFQGETDTGNRSAVSSALVLGRIHCRATMRVCSARPSKRRANRSSLRLLQNTAASTAVNEKVEKPAHDGMPCKT